jgi:alkanesulfonate monooxygenase SsuD/methylene tetrahydromethanopterin reductase-like flavin-dependent oxidoreductase (luciferase family)
VLAVAATATSTAVIGTNVLNAPWYALAILGRSLTTIDRLSNGRLVAGLGVGWSPEEYVAAGIPMNERGARLDEILDALTAWWTTDPVAHEGRYWHIPESHVQLKPISSPQPPIYLGGYSAAAMRRAARRADGWLPVLVPGRMEFDAQAVTGPMTAIRAMAAEAGRDPAELGSILRVYPQGDAGVGEVLEFLDRAGREAGVRHAFVDLMNIAGDIDEALEVVGHVLSRLG